MRSDRYESYPITASPKQTTTADYQQGLKLVYIAAYLACKRADAIAVHLVVHLGEGGAVEEDAHLLQHCNHLQGKTRHGFSREGSWRPHYKSNSDAESLCSRVLTARACFLLARLDLVARVYWLVPARHPATYPPWGWAEMLSYAACSLELTSHTRILKHARGLQSASGQAECITVLAAS